MRGTLVLIALLSVTGFKISSFIHKGKCFSKSSVQKHNAPMSSAVLEEELNPVTITGPVQDCLESEGPMTTVSNSSFPAAFDTDSISSVIQTVPAFLPTDVATQQIETIITKERSAGSAPSYVANSNYTSRYSVAPEFIDSLNKLKTDELFKVLLEHHRVIRVQYKDLNPKIKVILGKIRRNIDSPQYTPTISAEGLSVFLSYQCRSNLPVSELVQYRLLRLVDTVLSSATPEQAEDIIRSLGFMSATLSNSIFDWNFKKSLMHALSKVTVPFTRVDTLLQSINKMSINWYTLPEALKKNVEASIAASSMRWTERSVSSLFFSLSGIKCRWMGLSGPLREFMHQLLRDHVKSMSAYSLAMVIRGLGGCSVTWSKMPTDVQVVLVNQMVEVSPFPPLSLVHIVRGLNLAKVRWNSLQPAVAKGLSSSIEHMAHTWTAGSQNSGLFCGLLRELAPMAGRSLPLAVQADLTVAFRRELPFLSFPQVLDALSCLFRMGVNPEMPVYSLVPSVHQPSFAAAATVAVAAEVSTAVGAGVGVVADAEAMQSHPAASLDASTPVTHDQAVATVGADAIATTHSSAHYTVTPAPNTEVTASTASMVDLMTRLWTTMKSWKSEETAVKT